MLQCICANCLLSAIVSEADFDVGIEYLRPVASQGFLFAQCCWANLFHWARYITWNLFLSAGDFMLEITISRKRFKNLRDVAEGTVSRVIWTMKKSAIISIPSVMALTFELNFTLRSMIGIWRRIGITLSGATERFRVRTDWLGIPGNALFEFMQAIDRLSLTRVQWLSRHHQRLRSRQWWRQNDTPMRKGHALQRGEIYHLIPCDVEFRSAIRNSELNFPSRISMLQIQLDGGSCLADLWLDLIMILRPPGSR
jgi:hypothetical protein